LPKLDLSRFDEERLIEFKTLLDVAVNISTQLAEDLLKNRVSAMVQEAITDVVRKMEKKFKVDESAETAVGAGGKRGKGRGKKAAKGDEPEDPDAARWEALETKVVKTVEEKLKSVTDVLINTFKQETTTFGNKAQQHSNTAVEDAVKRHVAPLVDKLTAQVDSIGKTAW
jgi:hypothetical protein